MTRSSDQTTRFKSSSIPDLPLGVIRCRGQPLRGAQRSSSRPFGPSVHWSGHASPGVLGEITPERTLGLNESFNSLVLGNGDLARPLFHMPLARRRSHPRHRLLRRLLPEVQGVHRPADVGPSLEPTNCCAAGLHLGVTRGGGGRHAPRSLDQGPCFVDQLSVTLSAGAAQAGLGSVRTALPTPCRGSPLASRPCRP